MDWNARYLEKDTPWDHGEAPAELSRLLSLEDLWRQKRVLVPGCGRGHDVELISQSAAEVIGVDLSEQAIKEAQSRIGNLKVNSLPIQFVNDDVFAPRERWAKVDIIFEHTFYCALPPEMRKQYVNWISDILTSGGLLVGLFHLDEEAGATGPPWPTTENALKEMFADSFESLDVRDTFPVSSYRKNKTPRLFVRK